MGNRDLRELLAAVGGWEGFEIVQRSMDDTLTTGALGLPARRITIELRPRDEVVKRCGR